MHESWTSVLPIEDLAIGKSHVFKSDAHQVALFRLDADTVYAVDNRCPHEGYPLAQGTVTGCVLTCDWHNFKFDLRDGACIMGAEAVRTFPTRIKGEVIEIDLADPDPEEAVAALFKSLDEGMFEHRIGQMARDAVRLLELGVGPEQIAAHGARFDALHSEFGPSHGLPICADVLRWMPAHPGAQAVIPLAQALDMVGRANVRRPLRERLPPIDPGPDPVAAGDRLQQLVEDEQPREAEALMRGAIQSGWGPEVVYPWCFRIVSDHFLDFGHSLIYLIKLEELLQQAGWEHADPVLSSWVFGVTNATREDRLPEWKTMKKHLATLEGEWDSLWAACTAGADERWDGEDALVSTFLDGRRDDVFKALTEALRNLAPIQKIVNALSLAAATRLIRFDPAYDLDLERQDSWLSVTHIQTYMAAIRHAMQRSEDPQVLRLLFYGAMFVHKAGPLDRTLDRRLDTRASAHDGLSPLMDDIVNKKTASALGRIAAWVEHGEEIHVLKAALFDLAISDPAVRAIVVTHVIKNTVVAFEEFEATQDPRPLQGLVALLSSSLMERRVLRTTKEAIAFVIEGKVPRSVM